MYICILILSAELNSFASQNICKVSESATPSNMAYLSMAHAWRTKQCRSTNIIREIKWRKEVQVM
jgi:hypothetical protein